MPKYWRIRLKSRDYGDFTRDAWNRNEIGIWYGAWTPDNLTTACQQSSENKTIAEELSDLPAQQALWNLTSGDVATARRFQGISDNDWIVVYLSDTREIGLAKISGALETTVAHPLNLNNGEIFKYRKIIDKKSFKLSDLPDAYWLLPTQGRGNVHEFSQMWPHVKLLADSENEEAVRRVLAQKPFDELLDLLGASGWESFCFAYLIWEEGFVPTGLSTGRTLPVGDIVGRRRNGSRIFAQCKKSPIAEPITAEFRTVSETLRSGDSAFWFAYGGCSEEAPEGIHVVDRMSALRWAESRSGQLFRRLLLGQP